MIARLRGTLVSRRGDRVVVDVGGVGYEASVPLSTLAALPEPGNEVTLLVHTHVAEGVLALSGFLTEAEREAFEILLGVAGVGRALALAVLSGISIDELVEAVRAGDVRRLTAIRGVGKKTAERLVLELRDKLDGLRAPASEAPPSMAAVARGAARSTDDVVATLVKLGYRPQEAESAVARAAALLGEAQAADAARLLRESLRAAQP